MSPEELINPLIIYWDIDASLSDEYILRVCDGIIETGTFVLNLRDGSFPISENTINVLNKLGGGQLRLNLSVSRMVLDGPADIVDNAALSKLYIEFDSSEQLKSSLRKMKKIIHEGCPAGIAIHTGKHNVKEIPGFLLTCIENDIRNIAFPIQRYTEANIFYPDAEESGWVADEIKGLDLERLNLSVHDPFLWKLFYAKDNPNEEGCNGARTMMYINENLEVTPCPIFPFIMGSLRTLSLKEIASSDKRREIRNEISALPAECDDCRIRAKCKGGCRGRTFTLFEEFNRRDPACFFSTSTGNSAG